MNRPTLRTVGCVLAGAAALLVLGSAPALAQADAPSLSRVIDGVRNLLVGLLAALATLFLTIGGLRYLAAGGDPGQVERAKVALKSAGIGYVLAALAPALVGVLKSIVGA